MQSTLFSRYDPFSRGETLFYQQNGSLEMMLTIRPVWIIGDLPILYEWLSAPLKKTNWELNQKKMAVMQHYKQVLLSADSQSLMIEQNHKPLLQIDLVSARHMGFSSSLEYTSRDYAIHYLYRESFRDPDLFTRGLQITIEYIKSFNLVRFIFIRLLKPDRVISDQLTEIGFESMDLHNFYGKALYIYRIRIGNN